MFGVGVGVRVGGRTPVGGSAYDADAQAFFDRVTTAGGTLSETEKNATNTLVVSMKADGVWSAMKAIYPMVGASAAACAQNLKSSSFTGTFTSGWTFASNGVTPNGSSAYMDTGFNINTEQSSVHNYTHGFYSGTIGNAAAVKASMGSLVGASESDILIRWAGSIFYGNISEVTYNNNFANNDTHGFYVAQRSATNRTQSFKNGTKVIDVANTPTVKTNLPIYIGARNTNGTASNYDDKRCQFAFMGDSISDANQGNFYTAVQAFQTTLSRQV
jgi:hypothetical protein